MAQDAWNTRDPDKIALAYTEDSKWRNRDEFFEGREAISDFLKRKWARELDYRLEKNLWCFTDNRIAVKFEYGGSARFPWLEWNVLMFELVCLHLRERGYEGEDAGRL